MDRKNVRVRMGQLAKKSVGDLVNLRGRNNCRRSSELGAVEERLGEFGSCEEG